jgi:hypothetical protein
MSGRKKVTIKVSEKPKSSKKKTTVVKITKPRAAVHVAGHGDYRPTSQNRIRGRGDYFGDLLGGLGQKAGNWAQSKLSSLFGFGDYRTSGPKSNSLSKMVRRAADTRSENQSASSPSQNPFVMGAMSVQFAGGPPRIQHREYVGAVYATGSPNFSTTAYRIQPGLRGSNALMPWGCSVAGCFQMYELHGMVLEYVSTSSNYSATSALGSVCLSTVYDAEKPPLATLLEVNNNEFTTSANPSVSFYHPVECAKGDAPTTVRYVRTSNSVASSTDERLDDVGIFQVSLNGLVADAGTQVGELWCSYDITFLKAALPDLHSGTTAAFSCSSAPFLYNLLSEGYLISNPQNSLPVVVTHPLGLPPGAARFNFPTNYNGSYQLTMIATQDFMNSSANMQVVGVGSDISPVTLIPQVVAGSASTVNIIESLGINFSTLPGTTVANMMSFTQLFSTIAENPDQNFIDLLVDGGATTGLPASSIIVLISPLDNDIQSESALLEKKMSKDPQFRAMVNAMRSQTWTNLSPPSLVGPSSHAAPLPQIKEISVERYMQRAAQPSRAPDCASSASSSIHCAAALSCPASAVPASMSPPSSGVQDNADQPGASPSLSNPSVARVRREISAEYEEDRWVLSDRSVSSTPLRPLPPSQVSTAAEDALGAALEAALRRRGLTPL